MRTGRSGWGAGQRVSHFEILERLGSGGMGVVYKARDLRLGRLVALKFVAPGLEENEDIHRRFLLEARAASALDHPNVCTLYEIGETDDGRIFLAMAYAEGETLRERLKQGPMEPLEALRMAAQVAAGLVAAHARRIVHRDIKPANLLLAPAGVKIVDFGVARIADQSAVTRTGQAVGTCSYMAPEQLTGGEAGPAADLWSLGVVLYETLTGRRPFQARSHPLLVLNILEGTPPPLGMPGLPRVEAILAKALEKSPRLRYGSAREMEEDLLDAASRLADEEPPTEPDWRPALPVPSPPAPFVHNLPFPPLGELLLGRTEDLEALHDALEESGSSGFQLLVLHGLGGIGKTRLAVEHAWRNASSYSAALFVLADSPDGLGSGLAALARADLLNLPERNAPAESDATAAVLRWLRENPGWLLILDNVDTKEALLAVTRLLPALSNGRVVITSRRRDWPASVRRQSLDAMSHAPATEFLLKRTRHDRRREPDDVEQALRLAELLDGLPLALEQAGAFICHAQMSFADYLKAWEDEREELLSWHDEGILQYPSSLAVTWHRSFRQLTPTAQAILQMAAFLAPDPIPAEMFESDPEVLREAARLLGFRPKEIQARPVREDLAKLAALSLITLKGPVLQVHRMLQEVVRAQAQKGTRELLLSSVLKLVGQYIPMDADDAKTWPVWSTMRPHVMEVLERSEELPVSGEIYVSRAMTGLSIFLFARGHFHEAEPLMRRVVALDEYLFDGRGYDLSMSLHSLAFLLMTTNRLEEAEPMMRRSVDLARASLGQRDPLLTKLLNGLALLLIQRGDHDQTEELLLESLSIDQESNDPVAISRDLHNLAILFQSTGRFAEAEQVIRQSLEISRSVHGGSHPKTGRKLHILANLLRTLGRMNESVPLIQEACDILEQSLGPDHPKTRAARQDLDSIIY